MEQTAARRASAQDRDASPDLVKLPGGGDVMGGDDSFAAARAAQQARLGLILHGLQCVLGACIQMFTEGVKRRTCIRDPDRWPMRVTSPDLDIHFTGRLSKHSCGVVRVAVKGDYRAKQQLARREDLAVRASAAQAKEEDRMAMFRNMVAKGPIAIPKRQG